MSEGRRAQVQLLDGRQLDILVQPRLRVVELLNIVASHCRLKDPDKQYFGLAYVDEDHHFHWLQIDRDRKVLDHEFPRKLTASGATLQLLHLVRFTARANRLSHVSSVELFFLHTKMELLKGNLYFEVSAQMHLAVAYLLQVQHGDYCTADMARAWLEKLSLENDGFLAYCDTTSDQFVESVCSKYKELCSCSVGAAMLGLLAVCETSPTHGMHFYAVLDKAGSKCVLGINSLGVMQFVPDNMAQPKKRFRWKQLENLYYREKKFSLEIRGGKRVEQSLSSLNMYEMAKEQMDNSNNEKAANEPEATGTGKAHDELVVAVADPSTQVSVSRRTFVPSAVQVYAYFCVSPVLCKCIWSFAVAQHTFYLDSGNHKMPLTLATISEDNNSLAERLTRSIESGSSLQSFTKLTATGHATQTTAVDGNAGVGKQSGEHKQTSVSQVSLLRAAASLPDVTNKVSDADDKSVQLRQADLERYRTLRTQKRDLEQQIVAKRLALKALCVQEGNITGQMPKEIQTALTVGEPMPSIQRRVGTAFSLPLDLLHASQADKSDVIAELEANIEVQLRIVSAAGRLASDKSTNKSVRKKRQKDFELARKRLKDSEQRLMYLRHRGSQPDLVSLSALAGGSGGSQHSLPEHSASSSRTASLTRKLGELNRNNECPKSASTSRKFPGFPVRFPSAWSRKSSRDNVNVTGNGVAQSAPCTPHGSQPELSKLHTDTKDWDTDAAQSERQVNGHERLLGLPPLPRQHQPAAQMDSPSRVSTDSATDSLSMCSLVGGNAGAVTNLALHPHAIRPPVFREGFVVQGGHSHSARSASPRATGSQPNLALNHCGFESADSNSPLGYRPPTKGLQSSYRRRQYPTLIGHQPVLLGACVSGTGPSHANTDPANAHTAKLSFDYNLSQAADIVRRLSGEHRTHSQNSLQSLPPVMYQGQVEPLPDYRTAGASNWQHGQGAYNLPRQRTSWRYDSLERGIDYAAASANHQQANHDHVASPSHSDFDEYFSAEMCNSNRLIDDGNRLISQSGSSLGLAPPPLKASNQQSNNNELWLSEMDRLLESDQSPSHSRRLPNQHPADQSATSSFFSTANSSKNESQSPNSRLMQMAYSGSLDRRLIKARQKMRQQVREQNERKVSNSSMTGLQPDCTNTESNGSMMGGMNTSNSRLYTHQQPMSSGQLPIYTNSSSPIRALSASNHVNNGERVIGLKPFDSSDVQKYSTNRAGLSANQSAGRLLMNGSPNRLISTNQSRPPPPPYNRLKPFSQKIFLSNRHSKAICFSGSPQHRVSPSSPSRISQSDMSPEKIGTLPKKATIV